jgi:hypothetical protein
MEEEIRLLEADVSWEICGKIHSGMLSLPVWLFLSVLHTDTFGKKDGQIFELNAWILLSVREIVYLFSKIS